MAEDRRRESTTTRGALLAGVEVVFLLCNPPLGVDGEAVDNSEETRWIQDTHVCPGCDDSQVLDDILLNHAGLKVSEDDGELFNALVDA